MGDYVFAQFPGNGKKWYKAEIFSKYKGNYHLYYLEDGSVQKNVEEGKLKPTQGEPWTSQKRKDFLNQPFERPKEEGKWIVKEIGKRHRINKH